MPSWTADYTDFRGHAELREETAKLMQRTWIKAPVEPEFLAHQAGASCLLEQLSWYLADTGDTMMTPVPLYPAFPNDFKARSGVELEAI